MTKLRTLKLINKIKKSGVVKKGSMSKDGAKKDEDCWSGYKQVGMKKKGSKMVPNCVPEGFAKSRAQQAAIAISKKERGDKVDELSMSLKDLSKSGINKKGLPDKDKLKKDLEKLKRGLKKEDWVCGKCNAEPCTCEGISEDAPTVNTGAIPNPANTAQGKFKTSRVYDRRKKKGKPKLLKRFADYYKEKGIE